ncbi:chitinase [Nonomuraea sp. NN258]|uniref:fibronectin type III domain-containing protein n=1 Tax=Nonomuraea antri TaxID=2730852 RepID=UPI0015692935|nr:carbohydrate binding domain-containing protein [Nonomuraea antri]NRQ39778.1 chitinase [Nonomuraea antri]
MNLRGLAATAVIALGLTALHATPAQAANILVNPGFEADLSAWTCSAAAQAQIVSSPVHGGAKALRATPAGGDFARCQQTITVKPNTAYQLSAWAQGSYVFLGATGTGVNASTWGMPGSAWTQLKTSFTTGATTSSVTIHLNGWYGQTAYTADDVVLDGPGGDDTLPPTVPGNPAVGAPTAGSLTFTWSPSTDNVGVNRYEVSRDGGTPVSVTGTSYTATGLSASTTYKFKVRACDAAGNCSAYSTEASGTTTGTGGDVTPPTVPGNVAVGSPTTSSLAVTWSASTDEVGVDRYEVSRDTAAPVAVSGTSHTATGLAADTAYGFRVRACDAANNCSAYSTSVSGRTAKDTVPPGDIKYAPYIDITMPNPSLVSAANATGVKNYTLAFVLGDSSGCNPAWGGTIPVAEPRIINDVKALQAQGGQVIVASGGAMGPYLEHTCGSSAALLAAYKKVLDTVGTNHLDVDVEASIDVNKVNTALKQLQAERGTVISYTLRIQGQDYGVDPFSLQILQDAAAKGLEVVVNPMLMNFGYTGNWGDAMIAAAQATLNQMKGVWPGKTDAQLKRLLGVTPMIGKNDTGMTTTQSDARKLLTWANANHIGFIGFWSVARDNGGCPNGQVSPTCSGISQSTYEFSNIFKGFTG